MGNLSNKQNTRFGGLIAVLGEREPYAPILDDLLQNGFVEKTSEGYVLTESGISF